jgi:hypothetical protein
MALISTGAWATGNGTPAGRAAPGGPSATWICTLNRKPTASSLIPSSMVVNIAKPSRWYSTTGSRWA